MSFPCTELLLLNYAKVKKVFHSIAFQTFTVLEFLKMKMVFKKPSYHLKF